MKRKYGKLSLMFLWTGRLLLNAGVWYILLGMLYNNNLMDNALYFHNREYWLHIGGLQLLFFLLVYGNSFILVPLLISGKKYLLYFVAFLAWGILFAWAIGAYHEWLCVTYPGVPNYCFTPVDITLRSEHPDSWSYYRQVYLVTVLTIQFIFTPGWLVHYFFKARRKVESLSALQAETELKLLKAQIHPHFLFNVLNSIYALSLKKSDSTPEIVLRLSDCLRYLLYESGQQNVPLTKEIQLLEDYIAIEKIRVAHPENIILQIKGPVNEYIIIPALLLPFVENAIKHGFNSLSGSCWVHILIATNPSGYLHFTCRNSYRTNNSNKKETGGIGLQNVRKRLELCYPNRHKFMIDTKNNIFEVSLSLKLNAK